MGLDMYFYDGDACEIFYFRKHSDLHGWLRDQWLKLKENKEKTSDDFNCVNFQLNSKLIDKMEKYAKKKTHTKYSGFFWGSSDEDDWVRTIEECIPRLRQEIEDGGVVYYHPWW